MRFHVCPLLFDSSTDFCRHSYANGLTYYKYMTAQRHAETQFLLDKDVVFTTFATAAQDFKKGQSPLSSIHWFRIVLDEGMDVSQVPDDHLLNRCCAAHKIRNRTTNHFEAVHQLTAQRRWCLTGTPIQNRLEDLGSLVTFLKVPELERVAIFRNYIIAPTSGRGQSRFQNLQTLLGAICLRRTREVLNLPEPITFPRVLSFSYQERQQYDELYDYYRKQVQMAVSGHTKMASTTLQSIHELRLFCNNGPRSGQHVGESDDETLSYLQQFDEDVCANCSLTIHCINPSGLGIGGVFLPLCRHLVCHGCLAQCYSKQRICLICTSPDARPSMAKEHDAKMADITPLETTTQHPSKLLRLIGDIKAEPGHKW